MDAKRYLNISAYGKKKKKNQILKQDKKACSPMQVLFKENIALRLGRPL